MGRCGGLQEDVPPVSRARLSRAVIVRGVPQFIGGEVVISPPWAWQKRFIASDVRVVSRIQTPVAPAIVDDLYRRFADFRRAYDENGMTVDEFDSYPPTRRTLRQFIAAVGDLHQLVRDVMLPSPDTA